MQSSEAILLRRIRFGETSLIVTWLSERHGKIKTVVKGATRPKSGFSGRLDLFFTDDIQFAESQKSELHTLREATVLNSREGLRTRYANVQLAAYFVELIEAVIEPAEPVPEIYDLLERALDHLADKPASLRALQHFERELARLLGVLGEGHDPVHALAGVAGKLPQSRHACCQALD